MKLTRFRKECEIDRQTDGRIGRVKRTKVNIHLGARAGTRVRASERKEYETIAGIRRTMKVKVDNVHSNKIDQ